MKIKTVIFLFLFRSLNLKLYTKLRSLIQLRYIFPKKNTLSSFLLEILQNKNDKENKLRRLFADRILVIDYVKQHSEDISFPKIYWKGKYLSNKEFEKLPSRFYLKHRSSSGRTKLFIKKNTNIFLINKWIMFNSIINYPWLTREWFYRSTNDFLVESEIDSKELIDYKFFCRYGKPFLLQVDLERKRNHKRNLYSIENQGLKYNFINAKLHKFANDRNFILSDMKLLYKIAAKLSKKISFLRVDLYKFNNKVYFGELTNLPGSGFEKFSPSFYDSYIYKLMQKTNR